MLQPLQEAFGLDADKCISIIDEIFQTFQCALFQIPLDGQSVMMHILFILRHNSISKAVLTSQYAITNVVRQLAKEISPIRGERAVLGVPLFHAYAIFVAWIYFSTGSTIIIPEALKADIIANIVEKEDASDLWSVATIYQGIIDNERTDKESSPKSENMLHYRKLYIPSVPVHAF